MMSLAVDYRMIIELFKNLFNVLDKDIKFLIIFP